MLKIHSSKRNKIGSSTQLECVYQAGIGKWNIRWAQFDGEKGQESSRWSSLAEAGLEVDQSQAGGEGDQFGGTCSEENVC